MVSIVAFQAVDLGSTPGQRMSFLSFTQQDIDFFPPVTSHLLVGQSSTGGYTVYVGLDLESGQEIQHVTIPIA